MDIIPSPLNFTGGKYKLLPQILPLFPTNICSFVDLFCGGCNVGLNTPSRQTIYNDINANLLGLYQTLKTQDISYTFDQIRQIIHDYNLSLVSEYGYAYYQCESSRGLAAYNKDKFLRLRADFNRKQEAQDLDSTYYLMLYVLIVYSFNNQIRFNRSGQFNLPVGKRDFNARMAQKLYRFIQRLQEQNCHFNCGDFRQLDTSLLTAADLVYADPPYLITCAPYNEQGGWNQQTEQDLLDFLDELHHRQIRFALSNVLQSKGKTNDILIRWTEKNAGKYKTIPLQYSYANANYHIKDKSSPSQEVLIVNY